MDPFSQSHRKSMIWFVFNRLSSWSTCRPTMNISRICSMLWLHRSRRKFGHSRNWNEKFPLLSKVPFVNIIHHTLPTLFLLFVYACALILVFKIYFPFFILRNPFILFMRKKKFLFQNSKLKYFVSFFVDV